MSKEPLHPVPHTLNLKNETLNLKMPTLTPALLALDLSFEGLVTSVGEDADADETGQLAYRVTSPIRKRQPPRTPPGP